MSATTQCQKPLVVGAWGSEPVPAKPLVSSGNPDHDRCGELSCPPAPITPLTCGAASGAPSEQSLLVTLKLGTWGRKSYGLGGTGRSAMANSLGLGQDGRLPSPRATLGSGASLRASAVQRSTSAQPAPCTPIGPSSTARARSIPRSQHFLCSVAACSVSPTPSAPACSTSTAS